MLDESATFLLALLLIAAFVALVAVVAVAGAAASWAVRAALRARCADRRLEALRERHYEEVRAHARRSSVELERVTRARRPLVELEQVDFDDWPLLDSADPPVVFPRRRAA
ncbi:hypothetical protein [Conexibacter sp. CPCC 206217]|uniref:hypothetical protein n=1 Tax=Conexibacter sp. CPCC 206217 TaxID=3064574 RepID=UPI0027221835|nr:hypothetical protein [Conexibacter sp. CPCC 206217]MDO8209276.1 hypothetical protein [Conexibacter sp. CPCC 206217]